MERMLGFSVLSDVYIQRILNFSVLSILALLAVTVVLLTSIGIRFTHHVAGPLYRLEQNMAKLLDGEKVEPLHFRQDDGVVGLAEKFNAIAEKLDQKKHDNGRNKD
jgi:nitrogen fixation/metabolism regulation signal transduction histidine kinase